MYRKQIFVLIGLFAILRMVAAACTEFGNDEAYYFTYGLNLQWNYFDHPPGVAILINLFTIGLHLQSEFFVRLGSIVCAAFGSVLCYNIGKLIKNERTGLYAVALYNANIYTSVIAGTFILPDSPQMVFWLGSLYMFCRIIINHTRNKKIDLIDWIIAGALTGLCIMCKVHGIFLCAGLFLYILLFNRKLLNQPGLYLGLMITVIIISPILIWNIQNHFITFTYHGDRIAVHRLGFNKNSFLQAALGQLSYNNPVNDALLFLALFNRKKIKFKDEDIASFLMYSGLPIIIIVTIIAVFDPILPHWSGPGFLTLSFITAAWIDEKTAPEKNFPFVLKAAMGLTIIVITAGVLLVNFYPGTLGSKQNSNLGSGDFTLDMYGWKDMGLQYTTWLKLQEQRHALDGNLKIVCNKWFPAAHEDYYIARISKTDLVGVGKLNDLHNYAWFNNKRLPLQKGENALCIVPSNYSIDVSSAYKNIFRTSVFLNRFIIRRNGKQVKHFDVYLLKDYAATDEVHNIIVH